MDEVGEQSTQARGGASELAMLVLAMSTSTPSHATGTATAAVLLTIAVGEAIPEEAVTGEAVAGEAIAGVAVAGVAVEAKAVAEEAVAGEAAAGVAVAGVAVAGMAVAAEGAAEEAVAREAVTERAVSGKTVAGLAAATMQAVTITDAGVAAADVGIILSADDIGEDELSSESNMVARLLCHMTLLAAATAAVADAEAEETPLLGQPLPGVAEQELQEAEDAAQLVLRRPGVKKMVEAGDMGEPSSRLRDPEEAEVGVVPASKMYNDVQRTVSIRMLTAAVI